MSAARAARAEIVALKDGLVLAEFSIATTIAVRTSNNSDEIGIWLRHPIISFWVGLEIDHELPAVPLGLRDLYFVDIHIRVARVALHAA